jgi:hypothetical protein
VQDVLAEIQEVIDAPHLPFPDGNPPWQTDVKGAGDDRATDARAAQLEELIERVQRDIAEIKTDLEILRRSDFSGRYCRNCRGSAFGQGISLALESRLVSSICFFRWLKPLDRAAADKRYSTQPQRAEFA